MEERKAPRQTLADENDALRRRVAELEAVEADRMRREEKLRASEDKFKSIFERSTVGKSITSPTGEIEVNQAFCDMLGYGLHELQHRRWQEITPPGDVPAVERELEPVLSGARDSVRFAKRYLHKNGSIVWADVTTFLRRDARGRPMYFITSALDITERKRTDEALLAERRLFFAGPIVVFKWKAAEGWPVEYVSPNVADQFGYAPEDLTSGRIPYASIVHPDDLARVAEEVATHSQQGVPRFEQTYRIARADGGYRWVDDFTTVTRQPDGTITSYDGYVFDITERKRAERTLGIQHDLALALSTASDMEEALATCLDASIEASGMDCGGIYLLDEESGALDLKVDHGLSREFGESVSRYDAESPNARLVMKGRPVYGQYSKMSLPKTGARAEEGLEAIAVLPIHYEGSVVACLNVASHSRKEISKETQHVLEAIAAQMGSVIARIKAQEGLAASEERYRMFAENASDALWTMDLSLNLTYHSGGDRIFGFSAEEILKRSVEQRMTPESVQTALTVLQEELAAERLPDRDLTRKRVLDVAYYHKNGSLVYTEETVSFLRDKEGRAIGIIGVTRDITERKRAEEAVRESEERYRAIVEGFDGLIYICSQDYRVEFMNDRLRERTGYDGVGQPCYKVLHERDSICPWCINERVFAGENVSWEVQSPKDNRWYYVVDTLIRHADGSKSKQAMILDITDRKRAEEEKQQLQKQLVQAQRLESIARLAGGVAHDFNNMLGVILGRTELALRSLGASDSLRSGLQEIQKAAQRSADLTRQLLAFARKQTVLPTVVNLNQAVSGTLSMLRRLIGEDIELTWRPTADLWRVKMDPGQIDQVLANLCVNSRDAIAGVGKVTIETANATFDETYCTSHAGFLPGEYVVLAVSDDGCGMDEEVKSHLFEPFFTTKETGHGTGLGLATVYGIVRQNEGFINVYSEPGSGTTFRIYLRRFVGEPVPPVAAVAAAMPLAHGETILVVEDEEGMLRLCRKMLEDLGYRVLSAAAPSQAIRIAEEQGGEIALLVTDVVMPEMNGPELFKVLLRGRPTLRCLYVSGYTANLIAQRGVLDEGVHFLQKPYSQGELAMSVRKALETQDG